MTGDFASIRRLVEKLREISIVNSGLKTNLRWSKKSSTSVPPANIELVEISNERRRTRENEDRSTPSVSASGEDERMARITMPTISHNNDNKKLQNRQGQKDQNFKEQSLKFWLKVWLTNSKIM